MSRRRINNRYNLCGHTTPEGNGFAGITERLRKKFLSGEISPEELWEYCIALHSTRKPDFTVRGELSFDIPVNDSKFKTVKVWGSNIQISIEEHKIHHTLISV